MSIQSWNCRGLGNQRAVDVLSHLVREKAPKILFLMETKQSMDKMRRLQADLPYRCMVPIPSVQRSGGLALLWKEKMDLHVQTYSPNHIDALIYTDGNPTWRLTSFYGWPDEQRKKESWHLLKHLHLRYSLPWLCFGDFNEILCSGEKQGGLPKPLQPMQEFRSALLHCRLVDLGFQGYQFTWNNGRPAEAFVQERLDRAFATDTWMNIFPNAKVTHLQASYSDHLPILITTTNPNQTGCQKKLPKRFEEKWVSHPDCEAVVHEAWNMEVPHRSSVFRLFEKIKRCRLALVEWNHTTFGGGKDKLKERQLELEALVNQNQADHLPRIKELEAEINTILNQDKLFWRQRSRSIWLHAGDKNTKYFH